MIHQEENHLLLNCGWLGAAETKDKWNHHQGASCVEKLPSLSVAQVSSDLTWEAVGWTTGLNRYSVNPNLGLLCDPRTNHLILVSPPPFSYLYNGNTYFIEILWPLQKMHLSCLRTGPCLGRASVLSYSGGQNWHSQPCTLRIITCLTHIDLYVCVFHTCT